MTGTMILGKTLVQRVLLLLVALALGGCLEESSQDQPAELVPPVASQPVATAPIENSPPEIQGTPPSAVLVGETYLFTPEAYDVDQDFLEFSVTNKPAWAQFSDETGQLAGTPDASSAGESEDITITVTDGRDTRSIGPFRIRVNLPAQTPPPSNSAPMISGAPSATVMAGQPYVFQPAASDPDGDPLSFSVSNRPSWASFSSSTGLLSGTPGANRVATYSNIVISVSDGRTTAALPAFSIDVRSDNRAPTISGSPATSVQATQAYSFQPSASDPDGNALTYSISNRPSWASFSSSTGRLSGTPSAGQVGNYANIVISVSDGRASASLAAFSINVQQQPNRAPTITGTPATSVEAATAYLFRPTASDADKDTLGFSIENRPSWASFDTATGRLSGTPASTDAGKSFGNIVISVSDARAQASLPAFTIAVTAAANEAPRISGTPASSAKAGVAYDFRPTASDADDDTLTFSIENRPSWATFNTGTGRLSGTPSAAHAGTYSNIVISVSDGHASASLPPFAITVSESSNGSATVSWTPPTQNTDGSAISDLAGFEVVYGKSASDLTEVVQIANPGLSSYVVTDLASGTWHFAVKAYTTSGAQSALSNIGSKTIP